MYSKPIGIKSKAKLKPFLPEGFTSKILLNGTRNTKADAETMTVAHKNQSSSRHARGSVTMTIHWNTCAFLKGNYSVSAVAWPIRCEVDVSDNNFADG